MTLIKKEKRDRSTVEREDGQEQSQRKRQRSMRDSGVEVVDLSED